MKLMHVISSLNIGGAEKLLLDLCGLQIKDGHTVHVHVLKKTESFLEISFLKLNCSVSFGKGHHYSLLQLIELQKQIELFRPDVVHAHLTPAQIWCSLTRTANLVTTEHSTHNRRRHWIFKPFDLLLYSRFKKIVCITEATKSSLTSWIPNLNAKTIVIHNGIDLSRFSENRQSREKSAILMMVGRFEFEKDQDTIIKALVHLENLKFFLVGDGYRRIQLQNLVKLHNVEDRVHFLGIKDNIPELLQMADIYIHSAHWEGFGLAVVEAMASGLPVIVSDIPGLRDVVGDAGILFESGNVEQLVKCIRQLTDNEELRYMKSARSISQASKFSIENTANEYNFFYNRLLES